MICNSTTVRNIRIETTSERIVSPSRVARMRGLHPYDLRKGIMNAESEEAIDAAKANVFQKEKGRRPSMLGRLEKRNVKRNMNTSEVSKENTVIGTAFRMNAGALRVNLDVGEVRSVPASECGVVELPRNECGLTILPRNDLQIPTLPTHQPQPIPSPRLKHL